MPALRSLATLSILTVLSLLPGAACGGKVEPQGGGGSGGNTGGNGNPQQGSLPPGVTGTGSPSSTGSTGPNGSTGPTSTSTAADAGAPVACNGGGGSGGGGGGIDGGCGSFSEFADCSNGSYEVDCTCPEATCTCTVNGEIVATLPIYSCQTCNPTNDPWAACGFPGL